MNSLYNISPFFLGKSIFELILGEGRWYWFSFLLEIDGFGPSQPSPGLQGSSGRKGPWDYPQQNTLILSYKFKNLNHQKCYNYTQFYIIICHNRNNKLLVIWFQSFLCNIELNIEFNKKFFKLLSTLGTPFGCLLSNKHVINFLVHYF